jgi:signal transduction histidine kinase/CheY-like chemotaxis protein
VRRSLALLGIAGLLPIVILGGTYGVLSFRAQRDTVRAVATIDARFAAALLAEKLAASQRAIAMLAQSTAFDRGLDADRLRTLGTRVAAIQPDWRTISIADIAGQRLIDVPHPVGGPPSGRVIEPVSLARVVRTARPAVGDVVPGPHGELGFAVRAPVVRDGRVIYVASAVILGERLTELLHFQTLAPGWSAAILDRKRREVATTRADGPRAFAPSTVGDGRIDACAPVTDTGWTVCVRTSADAVSAPQRNALLVLIAAALLCLPLVGLLARLLLAELHGLNAREAAVLHAQRMEALGRLTGGVAHDLNNLLTPIVGGIDLIRRRAADDRTKRIADAALTSAERARDLVARLLGFARRQPLAPEPVAPARLLEATAELIRRSLPPSILLRIDAPPELPMIEADPAQLELVILNLAFNARDAMPDGGTLTIGAARATAQQTAGLPSGDYVAIAISDTGGGMDAATLKRAIEPFFTTRTNGEASGLGLSMAHGFAGQSGGMLRLESAVGAGTTATLLLPCSRALPEPAARPVAAILPPGRRILLVDDNLVVRRTTAEMLREGGQQVVEASGVDEALTILAADTGFDALVTDYVMPGRSGGDLIRAARAIAPGLPVLLVTGYVTAPDDIPAEIPQLMKPFRADDLFRALAGLLTAG